jgi:hypothetical protein
VIIDKVKLVDAFGDDLDFNISTPSSLTIINDSLANTPEIPLNDVVSVFPNPVTDNVFINAGDFVVEQVIITNPEGKMINNLNFQQNQVMLDCNGWDKGVYFLQIRTNEFVEIRRVIVQ